MNDDEKSEYDLLNEAYSAGQITIDIPDSDWMKNVNIFQDTKVNWHNTDLMDPLNAELNEMKEELANFKEEINHRLEKIEEQMAIVRPDAFLEAEFDELREAYEAYNKLMEKLRTFKALQDSA